MHIQIISFSLKGMSDDEFRRHSEAVAPAFAELPGLVCKYWLANPEINTYGGVYVWKDQRVLEAYAESDIYRGTLENPGFEDVTVKDFPILEKPTGLTRGMGIAI